MQSSNNNVVLAFSGGLDTSFCALWLKKEMNLKVHAVLVNTGGFNQEEINKIELHALSLGVEKFVYLEETENYYQSIIRYLVFGNVLKNNTYPLSVSAERIMQANAIANYALENNIQNVAHGSTAAGNDQVRFDMAFHCLIPNVKIITPIRDLKLSREAEIKFLKENNVVMNFEKAQYSINQGLWGTSVGGKETLGSELPLPENAFPTSFDHNNKLSHSDVALQFEKGELTGINEKTFDSPVEALHYLQKLAGPFAIGRDIHVGDTIIGIKGRVGFEAAAPLLVLKAHHLLEKHVLSKNQLIIKDQLAQWYGTWLHEGLYFDPVMRNIESFLLSSQEKVSGKVFLSLMPYRFTLNGVSTPHDLMSPVFGSYGEMNNSWSAEEARGFAKIFGNGMNIYHKINKVKHEFSKT